MINTPVVRYISIPSAETCVSIDAVQFGGKTPDEFKSSISVDDLQQGVDTWVLSCGTSTEVMPTNE